MIEIKNLGGAKVRALDGISLTIGDDEFLAVMGSSGSGKSTLLHMIGGIRRPRGACV